MKKTIIIEFLLLFASAVLMYFCVMYWNGVKNNIEHNILNSSYANLVDAFYKTLTYAILFTLVLLTTLTAIILIAIKDFPVFKPLLDKLNAHKQKRVQAKAERAEADKQTKIAELEAQLEELKND